MAVCGPVQSSSAFVDTYTAGIYPINSEAVLLSSAQEPPADTSVSHDSSIFLRPVTPSDSYTVRVKVLPDGPAVVRVVDGVCCVNGVRCDPGDTRRQLNNGSFIELGSSYRLQYRATLTHKPHPLRVLPPTPGSSQKQTPPPKPSRHSTEIPSSFTEIDGGSPSEVGVSGETGKSLDLSMGKHHSLISGSFSGSVEFAGMEEGLRARLKRIAKEINTRDQAHKDMRPPPPYEQVANSINYQLLHHTHPRVTTRLIDSLYSALKEMELKDHGLLNVYTSFLSSYASARSQGATPTCMMPADLPVVQFLTDMMMHICCMPDMTPLARKICPLWMDILSILSTSRPNREALVEMGGGSRILSLMHLSVMSEEVEFQERGWVILSSIVDSPTPPGRKPVILDASLSLILSLVAKQLPIYHSHLPLVTTVLHTLARLATVAKEAAGSEINSVPEDVFPTYTPLQGAQVLNLLREHEVLGHMMRVPPALRTHPHFHDNYCVLVKALHPIKVRKATRHVATPHPTKPPPKPARTRRMRRSTIATSAEGHKSREAATPTGDHVTAGSTPSKLAYSKSMTGRPQSYSVSILTGSADHVIHPLLPTEEKSTASTGHVTTMDSHVTSAASNEGSVESTKEVPLIDKDTSMTTVTLLEENHMTTENSHVTTEETHVTDIQASSKPVDIEEIITPAGHVTTQEENILKDHVTTPNDSATDPEGHVTTQEESILEDHVTTPDDNATDPEGHVTILTAPDEPLDTDLNSPVSTVTHSDQSDSSSFQQTDTLARDIQSLLDSLHAPLPSVALEGRGRRNSHYFRHSVKRRSRKEKGVVTDVGMVTGTEILVEDREESEEAGGQSSGRMQWGEALPISSFLSADSVSLFEVSGEVLSPNHTLLEEVVSGHSDIITTLGERAELLEGVLRLWREDKGLQAMTNTIQGCFSEDSSDIPLFMDALNCFLKHKGPWTLAVCCVLLPALREVVSSQRDRSCVLTVVEVLLNVVERFSELILACKGRSRTRRLSQTIDRQQQVLCYQQLHAIRVVIDNRLNMNFDPEEVSTRLRKIYVVLRPFKNKLGD